MAAQAPGPLAGTMTPRGIRIPLEPLIERLGGRRGFSRLLGALTVTETPQPGRPKTFARAKRTAYFTEHASGGDALYVPRVKAAALLKRVLARVDPPAGPPAALRRLADDACAPAEPLYVYQEAAVDFLYAAGGPLAEAVPGAVGPGPPGAAYIQMGTGMGKSRFGMAVIARARRPAFIVVPTDAIRTQWLDELADVYPGLRGGAYANPPKGSKRVPPGPDAYDVVVGIVNTVREKKPGFFAGYGIVILDEAHEYSSPNNMKVLWLAQEVPRVLGITAGPDDRTDGLDRIVYHFLGDPVWAERDIPGFDVGDVNFRGRVREIEYAGVPEFCETATSAAGTVSAVETIGNIVRDPVRLRLVAAEAERLFRMHETAPPETLREFGLGPDAEGRVRAHGIFIFAEHREYLPALRAALLERFDPAVVEAPELPDPVVLRGGASRGDLGRARGARIVLTTYGFSRRGVSLVDMTALILATPRRNGMRQILGRVTRRGSDESILRIIVDIKDTRSILKSQSSTRRAAYKDKLYPIYKVRVNHETFDGTLPPAEEEVLVWAPDMDDAALVGDF